MVARKSAVVLGASSVLGALVIALVFRLFRQRKKQSGSEGDQASTPTRTASKQGARARPPSAQGSPNDATAATHGTRLSRPVKPPRVPSATTPASADSTTPSGRISPAQNAPAARRKVVKRTGPRPAAVQRPSLSSQPGAAGLIPAAPAEDPAVVSARREPSSTPVVTQLAANVRSVRQPATVGKPYHAEPSTPASTQQQQVGAAQDHPIREGTPLRPKTGAVAAIAAEMAAAEASQRPGRTAAASAGPVTPVQPMAQTAVQEHVEPRAQTSTSPAVPEARLVEPTASVPTSTALAASADDLAPASQTSAGSSSAAAPATALSTDQSHTGAAAQAEVPSEPVVATQQASTANDAAELDIVAGLDMPSLDAAAAASVDSEVPDIGKPAATVAAGDAAKADKPDQAAASAGEAEGERAGVDSAAATIDDAVPEDSAAPLSQAAAELGGPKGTAPAADTTSDDLTATDHTSFPVDTPVAAAAGAVEPEPASVAVEGAEDHTAADLTPTDDAAAAPAADAVPPEPAIANVRSKDMARQLGTDLTTERSHEDASLLLADAIEAAADADAEPVAAAAGPIAITDSLSASTTGGAREASAAPVAATAESEASGVTGRRPSPDVVPQTEPDTPPKRVSLAPTVHAAEAAKQQRPSTRSSSRAGGSSSSSRADSSSSGSRKMTVADVIRESIKLKKSNERLKQQLNIKSGRKSSNSGRTSSSSKNVPVTAETKAAATGVSSAATAADKEETATLKRAASVDAATGSQPDQAPMSSLAAAMMSKRPDSAPASSSCAAAATDSNLSQTQPAAAAPEADLAAETPVAATAAGDSNSAGSDAEPIRISRRDRSSASNEQQQQHPSLSSADLLRELRSMKSENVELVKLLTAQLQEVRAQNAELMAAFHRGGPSLTAVQEETEGSGTRSHQLEGGNSTPTTGSELGTFKDRLRVPHLPRAGSITAGSDAGSSLRSAPAGMAQNTPTKSRSGLWRWASGGRRVGGAMTADNLSVGDNASIPDTLASPRSNISIPVETLVDLLNWGAR